MTQAVDTENIVQLVHFDEELAQRIWKSPSSSRKNSKGSFHIDDPAHGICYWVVLRGSWEANAPTPLFRSLKVYIDMPLLGEFETAIPSDMHEIAILNFCEIQNVDYCESKGYIQFNLSKGKRLRIFGQGYLYYG